VKEGEKSENGEKGSFEFLETRTCLSPFEGEKS